MMDVKSRMSSLAKSKPEVDTEELIDVLVLDESREISTRKSSEENSDSDFEDDDIDEYKALRKSTREKNDPSYREPSDLTRKSAHNQNAREVTDIYQSWRYDEEDLVNNSDDYGRVEQEEELYSSESGSITWLDGKRPHGSDEPDESDYNYLSLLDDTPAEILRDRESIIEKLGELKNVLPELNRKNRLLQYWVASVMTKKHQTMTPECETLSPRVSERRYIKHLITCKTTIDEIEARRSYINDDLNILENRLKNILEEDEEIFGGLLNREREIGAGLILEKSGRVLSLKAVNTMTRRQLLHREMLNRNRFKYIFLQHQYEDLKMELRLAETLGEGMTIMDFDTIQLVNYSLRDKLEEREKDLEKLYVKAQELLNALNNYKEKDIFYQAEIYTEKLRLENIEVDVQNSRNVCNTFRLELKGIRENLVNTKRRGGILFATPVLGEMEKTLKTLNDLSSKIERMVQQVRSYPEEDEREVRTDGTQTTKMNIAGARTTVTRMTKVKRSESRNKPGRC